MKKFITTCLTVIFIHAIAYTQDSTKLKVNKPTPYVINGGRYIVTIDNGKVTSRKNPNFDETKAIKREAPRGNFSKKFEIYLSDSNTPIIKKYLIDDLNSELSAVTLTKDERMAKYDSKEPVEIVHLKPGVVPLTTAELFSKFKVANENINLPLYLNYRPIAKPNELMGVPDAIAKIDVVTDGDGVRFLNIVTKTWKAFHDTHPDAVYIR